MADPLDVQVVCAERVVWSGQASNIIARTTDGDIGILAGHEPVLAILVPSGIEIYSVDNHREIVAVDGGFISTGQGRVSILSEYARMAEDIDVPAAEKELADAQARLDDGHDDEDTRKHFSRAQAQVRAAQKVQ